MTGQKDSVKPPDVSLGQKAVGGGLAVAFTQFGGTFINLLATMFLARLVLTEDFGLLAKVMAVTGGGRVVRRPWPVLSYNPEQEH